MPTFTNQATLSYNNTVVNSNIVSGELAEALTMTKNATSATYNADGTVTYVISLVNSGATPITDLTLTDALGGYTVGAAPGTTVYPSTYVGDTLRYYVNGVERTAPTANGAPQLIVSGIEVPAGGNTQIIYTAAPTEYAPLAPGSTVTNTVTATADALAAPITASEILPVSAEPVLSITKSVNPQTVVGTGPLTYTFEIDNRGNAEATAADAAVVTDIFDPILNITGVALNGQALTSPADYTYDTTTGTFATTPGTITVPAAGIVQDPDTGIVTVTPARTVLTVTGTV